MSKIKRLKEYLEKRDIPYDILEIDGVVVIDYILAENLYMHYFIGQQEDLFVNGEPVLVDTVTAEYLRELYDLHRQEKEN